MAAGDGLISMTPTSISYSGTSAGINADGGVDFTTVNSLSLNGVFTGDYDNYTLIMSHIGSSTGQDLVSVRLRSVGTDDSGSNYTVQSLYVSGTTVAAGKVTATGLYLTNTDSTYKNGVECYIYGPCLTQPTATRSVAVESTSSALLNDFVNTHSLSNSYDGFTIIVASPDSITGTVHVFGYEE